MENKRILLGIDNFKFSILDSVPKPEQDIAYVLYKEEGSREDALVITAQKPVLSSQIRAKGFNKRMSIFIGQRDYEIQKEISDNSGNFKFSIYVNLQYFVQDIKYIFFNQIWDIDNLVENCVLSTINGLHKIYEIECQVELEHDLRIKLLENIQKLDYLKTNIAQIQVGIDERAQKIIDSNLDTLASHVLTKNEGEKASIEIEQKKIIEIQKTEAEKEIQEKRNDLYVVTAKGLNSIKNELGEDGETFLAFVRGEISAVEYDEKMRRNRNENIRMKMQSLKQLVDLDILSGPALENAAMKLLGEEMSNSVTEQNLIAANAEKTEEIIIEDTEEY